MNKEMTVITGPVYNPVVQRVQLNGVLPDERLTPRLARRAVRVAAGYSWPATVWDNEYGYGYRLYAKRHRKIYQDD